MAERSPCFRPSRSQQRRPRDLDRCALNESRFRPSGPSSTVNRRSEPMPALPPMLSDRGPRRRISGGRGHGFPNHPPQYQGAGPRPWMSLQSLPPAPHQRPPPRFYNRPPRLVEAYSQPHVPSTCDSRESLSSLRQTRGRVMCCAFCKSNREAMFVQTSHWLKDKDGKITCPVLRRYVCKHCGATGDNAHTDSYCPQNSKAQQSMKSVLTTTKTSAGSYRNLYKSNQ